MEDNRIHLFLSYGHEPQNEAIIKKLIEVLKKEFKIWIDKRDIPDHEDWRRAIIKGISDTDLTVGLLSEYSTREKGVCLDELGISISIPGRKLITILLENQKNVSIPSTITRNQWLDLSQWKKYIGTDQWDAYFSPKTELLLASIKSKENIEFQGEITKLYKILKPEDFNSKAALYINGKDSVIRPWLIDKVNAWLQGSSSGRFLLITGDAGTGKSHFSAMYQHYNPFCAAGAFFEHGKINSDYVKDTVRYLIYTLATRFPDYRYRLLNLFRLEGLLDENDTVQELKCADFFSSHTAENLFDRFLCITMIGGTNVNMAIVLDGLDEVIVNGDNPMLTFLCSDLFSKLPSFLKIIITARAESSIMTTIQKIRPEQIDLNDVISDSDIEEYIIKRLSSLQKPVHLLPKDIKALVERSNRMFLFAKLACDAIAEGTLTAGLVSCLPNGIGGLFSNYFDRLFPKPENYDHVKPFLRVICAFDNGNLSEAFLMKVTGANSEILNDFYLQLRSFAQSRIIDQKAYVFLFHKSLYDWLTDRSLNGKYYIDTSIGIHMIAESVKDIMENASEDTPYEFLKNAYRFVLSHGMSENLRLGAEYLYVLQLSAYNNSDIEIYSEVTQKVESAAEITGNTDLYILSQLSLLGWYYEVAMDQDKALRLLDDLYSNYSDDIRSNPEIYTAAEINRIYIINSCKKNYSEALDWAIALIRYIRSCGTDVLPSKGVKLAKAYYHRCIIEFRLKQYDDCIESANKSCSAADLAYNDPRRLKCLVYTMQGAAYREKKDFAKALDVLLKSLEYRLSLYGFYTLFVANAYRNLFEALYYKTIHTGSAFEPQIFEFLESYRKIVTVIMGEKNPRLIHYYYIMARIAEHDGEKEKAAMYAKKGLEIKTKYYEEEQAELKQLLRSLIE